MKVKVNDAERETLNWMVAKAMGLLAAGRVVVDFEYMSGESPVRWEPRLSTYYSSAYSPSTDWAQGGPIMYREGISAVKQDPPASNWWAFAKQQQPHDGFGPTPLIAAMRCFVSSRLGDEVEIPDELV